MMKNILYTSPLICKPFSIFINLNGAPRAKPMSSAKADKTKPHSFFGNGV
jgi:hypothetical protein